MHVIRSSFLAMLAVTVAGCAGEQGDSTSLADRERTPFEAHADKAAGEELAQEELEELSDQVQEEREQLEKDLARQMGRE